MKQTEIGLIPDDWEVKRLGDVTRIHAGGTPSTLFEAYWNGNIRWMNSGELNLKRVYEVEGRITELGLNNSSTHLIPKGCVLIGLAGQGKTRGTAAINYVDLCTNQSIAAIFPSDFHNSDFLYHVMDNKYQELRELSDGGGGRGGLNLKILNDIQIPLPPLPEQQRIAKALSDVDALISTTEKLLQKKRNIKQGTMQELLTGKKRLPGFAKSNNTKMTELGEIPEDWEVNRLGDYVSIVRGGSPRPIQDYLTTNSDGINWIKIGDVKPEDKYIVATEEKIIPEGKSRSREVHKGDFILSNSMSFGRPYILQIDGCIHDGWLAIQNYQETFDSDFLYYLLGSDEIYKQYIEMAAGSSVQNLNKQKVRNLIIPILDKEEQNSIAKILSDMDNEIDLLNTKLEKYRNLKTAMIQQLLTGKIRLV